MLVREQVPLAPLTTFGFGGPARWLAEAESEDALVEAVSFGRELGRPLLVLGGGRNVLVFDEGFVGFRLGKGGAQEYFGVKADMVTYGKTLGGGLPIGALVGRKDLMRRFNDERPSDICFARGTFNAHPYVMGGMNAFLRRLQTPEIQTLYEDQDAKWDARAKRFNDTMAGEGFPVRAANLQSIWTLTYTEPGRYHWMLQCFLR